MQISPLSDFRPGRNRSFAQFRDVTVRRLGSRGTPGDAELDEAAAPVVSAAAGTDSAVSRAVTRRADFVNVRVSLQLRIAEMVMTARTRAQPLAEASHRMPLHTWVPVSVSIVTVAARAVRIELSINGKTILTTTIARGRVDPILAGGRVGLRGDNCQFCFRDFTVTPA